MFDFLTTGLGLAFLEMGIGIIIGYIFGFDRGYLKALKCVNLILKRETPSGEQENTSSTASR